MYILTHCVSAILAQAVLAQACLLETGGRGALASTENAVVAGPT